MISSIRSKRNREFDAHAAKREGEEDIFTNKRMCSAPITRNKNSMQGTNECPMHNGHLSAQVQEGDKDVVVLGEEEEEEDSMSNDMEINDDEIVSNFNQVTLHGINAKSPPSYPVFPPLQRSGRKIDHLVDEVLRKSSRVNHEHLQVSIPPSGSDFEFQMPSYVSVGGGPMTDSRFLSSPEGLRLSSSAIRHATIPIPPPTTSSSESHMNSPTFMHNDENTGAPSCARRRSDAFSSPLPFHLGNVSHSDWFENCTTTDHMHMGGVHRSDSSRDANNDNGDEEEEDCEDMYVDA